MTKQIPYLDGWRGLAIACLLAGHFFPVPGLNFGIAGVALFFVLSGLLMTRVLFIQQTGIGSFYRRRIARIFPSVAAYLAIISGIFLAFDFGFSATELIAALTFTNNYFVTADWQMPFGHIWSLSVEEHAYVILSVAAVWCRFRKGSAIAALAFVTAASLFALAIYAIVLDGAVFSYTLRTGVASFGIFCSGFVFLLGLRRQSFLAHQWLAPVALVAGVLCHWWSVPPALRIVAGWGALAIAINAMPSAHPLFIRFFELTWLRKLGLYSFSIYLWQQPFYQLFRHHGMPPEAGLMLSLITGYIAFHVVENPARIYLNTHWGAHASPEAQADIAPASSRPGASG